VFVVHLLNRSPSIVSCYPQFSVRHFALPLPPQSLNGLPEIYHHHANHRRSLPDHQSHRFTFRPSCIIIVVSYPSKAVVRSNYLHTKSIVLCRRGPVAVVVYDFVLLQQSNPVCCTKIYNPSFHQNLSPSCFSRDSILFCLHPRDELPHTRKRAMASVTASHILTESLSAHPTGRRSDREADICRILSIVSTAASSSYTLRVCKLPFGNPSVTYHVPLIPDIRSPVSN